MANYTKVFDNPYPNGWKNLPSESTPVTAEALQEHTDAIENIEAYLYDNPISGGGGGGSTVQVDQLLTSGTPIADITVDTTKTTLYAPTGGGGNDVELTKSEYDALPDSKLTDGKNYFIKDYNEGSGSAGIAYELGEHVIGTYLGHTLYRDIMLFNISVSSATDMSAFIQPYMDILVNAFVVRHNPSNRTRTLCDPITIWYSSGNNAGWKCRGVDTATYATGDIQHLILEFTKVGE